jgi:DNA-binding NtrC family response regulator
VLVQHFIKKFSRDLKLPPAEVSEEAMKRLLRYPWPGNIRELEGAIRTALVFAKGKTILPEHLNLESAGLEPGGHGSGSGTRGMKPDEESSERQMIMEALKQNNLDKEAAAKKLGMGLRTLYTRMGLLGIPKKKTLLSQYLGLR